VGIIDGQHRVFCYHEGSDVLEPKIAILRKRQHLLVTGIIYPSGIKEQARLEFEARLFLEINDTHPCQFPVALVQRLVRALCPENSIVLDPYMGVASAGVAAIAEGRRFVGAELNKKYLCLASERLKATAKGNAAFRPIERPIFQPDPRSEVATIPSHFKIAAE
jgi:DNA modification methylase